MSLADNLANNKKKFFCVKDMKLKSQDFCQYYTYFQTFQILKDFVLLALTTYMNISKGWPAKKRSRCSTWKCFYGCLEFIIRYSFYQLSVVALMSQVVSSNLVMWHFWDTETHSSEISNLSWSNVCLISGEMYQCSYVFKKKNPWLMYNSCRI